MKYMFLMYGSENQWTDEERNECVAASIGICNDLAAKGKFIATSPLQSVSTATTIRVRNGQPLITDGPFAETTEQLGGYFIFDLADLDEAIAVASRLPPAKKGTAEIRPLFALEGLPPSRPLPPASSNRTPYILLAYDNEKAWQDLGPTPQLEAMAEAAANCRELNKAGKYLSASPLHPVATATCVRIRNGKREITDGPFAETNEVLGGFYLILTESRDEALNFAMKHPGLRFGSVEVRPLLEVTGLNRN